MKADDAFPVLGQFVASYFHQDWTSEANSVDEVILRFKHDNPRELVDRVVKDIDELLAVETSEPALETRLTKAGLSYSLKSEGYSYRQWLEYVRTHLSP